MKFFILVFCFLFFGCTDGLVPMNPSTIDRSVWHYAALFELDFETEVRVPIETADLSVHDSRAGGMPVYGRCSAFSPKRLVQIDFRALRKSRYFVEKLVFHQLGHCVFSLPHVNEPYSLMRTGGASEDWADDYRRNRRLYIEHFRGLLQRYGH